MKVGVLVLATLLMGACASGTGGQPAERYTKQQATDLLSYLGKELQKVRSSTDAQFYLPVPLEPLRGLSRKTIGGTLGKPDECEEKFDIPECATPNARRYKFYRHPPLTFGFGLHLVLTFDEADRIKEARWQSNR